MGNMERRRQNETRSSIPDDIKAVFEEADIKKVFDYLESFFHLSKEYRNIFSYELKKQPREIEAREFFYRYVREHIAVHIAIIIRRNDCLDSILRYLLKSKIQEYQQSNGRNRNYH